MPCTCQAQHELERNCTIIVITLYQSSSQVGHEPSVKASVCCAASIQRAWKAYQTSTQRACRLAAIVKIQAHVRAGLARQHAKHLHCRRSAVAAMDVALSSGSTAQVQAAAVQLVQTGVLNITACI